MPRTGRTGGGVISDKRQRGNGMGGAEGGGGYSRGNFRDHFYEGTGLQ